MTQCELSSQQKKKAAVCKVCNDPEISVWKMLKLQSECSLFRADESPFLSDEISKDTV